MSVHVAQHKAGLGGWFRRLIRRGNPQLQPDDSSAPTAPSVLNRPTIGADTGSKYVQLPLRAIIAALPLELRGKVKKAPIADVTIPVLQSKILGQISSGAVRLSFGEIRCAAPAVFLGGGDADQISVTLPLGEILPRLNPALLTRKPTQRQVELAREITSPFEDPSQALVFSVGGGANAAVAAPTALAGTVLPPSPLSFKPLTRTATPAPQESRVSAAFTPETPVAPFTPPPVVRPTKPLVVRMTHPPKRPPANHGIMVSLASLAENWSEALREEIVQCDLGEARVALPTELIEIALKRGRAAFPWKVVRSWIRPAVAQTASDFDSVEVELPLRVVAPLFMQRRNPSDRVQQRADIDESIPNLFFGFPKPDAPAAPATPDTNYYVFGDTNDSVQVTEEPVARRRAASGTEFVAKYATPNEIVARASALDGVAGAVIALPDGLMVASHIPPEHNGETLAAFLPQIFARITQSTKELRMGELNNLSFTVGNVPWKIFRVNAIFFAAFGREGHALPTSQLAGLAGELDRKNR